MKRNPWLSSVGGFLTIVGSMLHAQTVKIQFDPAQSKITWTLPDVLHTVAGTFALEAGAITYEQDTGAATGLFTVQENTGESGNSTRDNRMKKSVLKTSEYPLATFRPTHVTGGLNARGGSTLAVDGVLRMYGADHPMRLAFQVNRIGDAVEAKTGFGIPYVAWGMRDPSALFLRVGKSVAVTVEAKGKMQILP